jgi:cytochrome c-type biogenesis protein CcmH/NrfG
VLAARHYFLTLLTNQCINPYLNRHLTKNSFIREEAGMGLMVCVARCLSLCVVLLALPVLMLPDAAFAQPPTLAINPTTQGPPGTIIPVLGNAQKAITFLTQMITLAMQNGGEGQEAQLEALKQQIEALPKPKRGDRKTARLQNDKGLEEFKKERYEQALQFFLTAYQLDAGDVEAVNNVGMAYLKTGNLQEAARYLGGALSLAPNCAAAWGNLAEVFARDSRLAEAVAAYALTYRYSKNKDATRRLLEAQTTNVSDPQVMQTAKAALALPLISGRTESGEDEYRGLAEKRLGGLKEQPALTPPMALPVPTPTPRAREAEEEPLKPAHAGSVQMSDNSPIILALDGMDWGATCASTFHRITWWRLPPLIESRPR